MTVPNADTPAASLHARAVTAFEQGRADEARDLLREAISEHLDLEQVNDLAVISQTLGRDDEARQLLAAALAVDPERDDVRENLAALDQVAAERESTWRASKTLGGDNPDMFERAFPGMPRPDTMSEHTSRYAYALGLVGGLHVLDLGCGTGYGSEMLTWSAASVRGFDLWQPQEHERPRWTGRPELNYGHDLCKDPVPTADAAVMYEVIEHLPDAPAALRLAWGAVDVIVASFPNPVYHGSWMNEYHVNDWTLEEFERELEQAAAGRFGSVEMTHLHQPQGSALLVPGRDPESSFWVVVARGVPGPAPAQTELKEREEIAYWRERKAAEGSLSNSHYEFFWTDHFGLDRDHYDGKRMLDVGCGPRGSLEWATGAVERQGLDPLADSYRELGTDSHAMSYVATGAEHIPFPDGHFDVVSTINSLDHVEDLDATIEELKRVVRPGGELLLITDVNHDPTPCEPHDISWDIVARFAPGFRVVDLRHFEKVPAGMYDSLRHPVAYDHNRPGRRYGILSVRLERLPSDA
jgi:2-polyprenyl-3-methyl-5-hydroxy-6-metoxy-1,4-benzoquinol methylase